MATTTVRGHVSRALDFFERTDIYMGIGRTTAWADETTPPAPSIDAIKLEETIGYKKLEKQYLVVPDDLDGTISYRSTKWRIVSPEYHTTTATDLLAGTYDVTLNSVADVSVKDKLVIGPDRFTAKVTNVDATAKTVTLDTAPSVDILTGASVEGGALIEGARWVYVEAQLLYDELPLKQYRQIGVFSRLEKGSTTTAGQTALLPTEVADYGILEVIDNRKVVNRQIDQKEQLSIVVEF